ncbi:hypothetical protein EW026_g4757 [Hermanssonia centrifuga]|uniref:Cysteine-rich protein 1 n=1 Tax=Hermanssonia centrifuga TaxID=98765 RepID=A0A4S4KGV4_9APHY|nr:hypothetical protein EW026_g4757 [Hermanssonia centrifuga]
MTGPPRTTSPTKDSTLPVRVVPTSTGDGATAQGNTIVNGRMSVSLTPKTTGTRYGAALSGGRVASPMAPMAPMATGRQWGGGTPSCGRCGKTVYFAEQVKAIGKTWHRNCLRCTECNHLLDSSRLTENEGNPYCSHCYGKVHGPKGNGYALLGKAGG